jgi:glycosyltransferase involved in cell wall biosynthesis
MVSVVIPAFDEAGTVGDCIAVALRHPDVVEVILVDDGSSDRTAEVARAAGARVLQLEHNGGKAAALDAGVRAAKHDVLLFLDADITGHTVQTLSLIMLPVINGRFEMHVGIRARKTIWLNRILHFFPIIGGERALTRSLWEATPHAHTHGFQIEIALNYTSKRFDKGMGFALIPGTFHRIKEKKYGIALGLFRRLRMIADVLAISFRLYVLGRLSRRVAGLHQKLLSRG